MRKPRSVTKRIATDALFTALGLITFLIENLFPPIIIPGAKMGLSNIFSLAALILFGPVDAFAVVAARTLLGSVFAGNVSALIYSFTGGMTAMAVSSVLVCLVYPRVSIMSVSVVAAVSHNIMQNIMFVVITQSPIVFSYMPYLALLGLLSGAIVGAAVMLIFKRVPLNVYRKALGEFSEGKSEKIAASEGGETSSVADDGITSACDDENSYKVAGATSFPPDDERQNGQ